MNVNFVAEGKFISLLFQNKKIEFNLLFSTQQQLIFYNRMNMFLITHMRIKSHITRGI